MLDSPTARLAACMGQVAEEEDGQGLVEYALIVLLISIVSIAALTLMGTAVSDIFDTVVGLFP